MKIYGNLFIILSIGIILSLLGCKISEDNNSSKEIKSSTETKGLKAIKDSEELLDTGDSKETLDSIRDFKFDNVAKFDEPWALVELPDQRLLITEKKGKLKLFDPRDKSQVDVSNVPNVVYGGQGGLGDVQLHPNFNQNQWIYLSYVESDQLSPNLVGAVVIRAKLDLESEEPELTDIKKIWTQVPKFEGYGHYSHRIVFDREGKLWISSGERQEFTPAQDMNSNAGKIIRLNDNGSIPADNPFQIQGGIAKQIWTLGHRNVLGLAFDHRQQLWAAEMGPQGGDELNLIVGSANYGYPIVSEGTHYDSNSGQPDFLKHKERPEFRAPELSWTPVISPASLIFYKGHLFPRWKNKAILAGLSSQAIVIVDTDKKPVAEIQRISMNNRIRAVVESKDGTLWVLKDGNKSPHNLIKIVPQ